MHTPLKSNHPRRRRPSPAKGVCAGCSVLFGPKHMENWVCFPSCGHSLLAVFKSPSLGVSAFSRSCFVAAFFQELPELSQHGPALGSASIPNPAGQPMGTAGSWPSLQSNTPGRVWGHLAAAAGGGGRRALQTPSRAGKEHIPPHLPTASKAWVCHGPQPPRLFVLLIYNLIKPDRGRVSHPVPLPML